MNIDNHVIESLEELEAAQDVNTDFCASTYAKKR